MSIDPTGILLLALLSVREWAACLFYIVGTLWFFKNWQLRKRK